MDCLVWSLDNKNYAIDLSTVLSVYLACEWTSLPGERSLLAGMAMLLDKV
jgi:chemotaxis signal transduction protein